MQVGVGLAFFQPSWVELRFKGRLRLPLVSCLFDAPSPLRTPAAALVYEVWAAVSQLPYTDRFCLYSDLKVGARWR